MDKKEFIDQLFIKRSKYLDPDQSEMTANLLETVSRDIYSESVRFVFELIQNADDSALNENSHLHFDFHGNTLVVSHSGKSFDEGDIQSLTSAGKSQKENDPTKTGYKGIGFKSVFGTSDKVAIFSGGFQFRFERAYHPEKTPWQVIPIWTEKEFFAQSIQAVINQHYPVSTIIEIDEAAQLRADLEEVLANGNILLFLRRLSFISVSYDDGVGYTIERKLVAKGAVFDELILLKDNQQTSSWIVRNFGSIPIPQGTKKALLADDKTPPKLKSSEFTELAFAAKTEDGKIILPAAGESLIFTYLPTKVLAFQFPFLLNASFLTSAPREALHEDRLWNQWLMQLAAEKLMQWIVDFAGTKYEFDILKLLPSGDGSGGALRATFNRSLESLIPHTVFIPSTGMVLKKPAELMIDNTGLSVVGFISQQALINFINREKGTSFGNDPFVSPSLRDRSKLHSFGTLLYDIEHLESFFLSPEFLESHLPTQNFELIAYFYEQCKGPEGSLWTMRLQEIPFIFSEDNELKCPVAICFPGAYTTDFGAGLTVIHSEVWAAIDAEPSLKDWLEQLGVKEPSDEAYLENEILGNIDTCITATNYLTVTQYLFSQHKKGLLSQVHYDKLRDLNLMTTANELTPAKLSYLVDFYEPVLRLEAVNTICRYVIGNYRRQQDLISEWKTFFQKIGVAENVEQKRITLKATEAREQYASYLPFFEENKTLKYSASSGNIWYNPITKYNLLVYSLIEYADEYAFSKLFWDRVFRTVFDRKLIDTGSASWYNSPNLKDNFFEWCLSNSAIFPTTLKSCLKAGEVFINDKEITEIAGDYLPVLDYPDPLTERWKGLIAFRKNLSLDDYLGILEKMATEYGESPITKADQKRLGIVYNKLAALMPDISAEKADYITEWANENSLPATNLRFQKVSELKFVNIARFSTTSENLKVILLPENFKPNTTEFQRLLNLLGIPVINRFDPFFGDDTPKKEVAFKNRLLSILPYFALLAERKHYADFTIEFSRMLSIIEHTDFYSSTEIQLTFHNGNEVIGGPLLPIYRDGGQFYYKGSWKKPVVMYGLIPELTGLLDISGMNDELRLLLDLPSDEIEEYLNSQHYDLQDTAFLTAQNSIQPELEEIITDIAETIQANDKNQMEVFSDSQTDEVIDDEPEQEWKKTFKPSYSATSTHISTPMFLRKSAPTVVSQMRIFADLDDQQVRDDVGRWSEERAFLTLRNSPGRLKTGLPSVQFISRSLNLSQRYLSDMLRSFSGQNTQQYIQQVIIEKAKEKLSATNLSVSEIAYQLGFEHPQSFNKLFKAKTNLSPLAFRQSFN